MVDFGSISEAARRLGESKGAISRRMSRLEARLGARLLARTSRAVTATEEGLAFHAKAQAALALLDEAADSARGARDIPRGHLRITTAIDLSVMLLPPIIAAFRARHPQITVEIVATDTAIDLAAHRIDLALRIGLGDLPDQSYRGVELRRGILALYAAPAWAAANRAPLKPADRAGCDLLLSEKQGPGRAISLAGPAGRGGDLRGRAVVRATDLASVLALTEAGAGVALLPDVITGAALARGTLVRVLDGWSLPGMRLHALTIAGRDIPARVRLSRDFLREQLAV